MVVAYMKTSEVIDADKAVINFVLGKDMVVFMEMLHHSNSTLHGATYPYSRHQTLFILVWRVHIYIVAVPVGEASWELHVHKKIHEIV